MQGYLTKPNKIFGVKKRFFVLERCTLTYYENDTKAEKLAEIKLNAETRISAAGSLQQDWAYGSCLKMLGVPVFRARVLDQGMQVA